MFARNIYVKVTLKNLYNVKSYSKTPVLFNNYAFRNNDFKKKRQEDLVFIALESISVTEPQDWNKVTQFVLEHELNRYNNYNPGNIDGRIMGYCVTRLKRSDLAKSYLKHLEEQNIKPNLATLGKYLKLLYQNNQEKISKEEENEILQLCKNIEQNNPVLDSLTQENMIMALSLTKEWKKCLDILQEIKITASPSIGTYCALISAAFLNKEEQLAWDLLREILDQEKPPLSITFLSYLKTLKRMKKQENILQKLEKLFIFFKENEITCKEDVVKNILEFSKSSSNLTTVQFSGYCEQCNKKLNKFELGEDDFAELKEVFFKNAIVGKDIFIRSDPAEMREFQNFVAKMGKFDVVLDGLNIAYSAGVRMGSHVYSKTLAAVVSHFAERNKSVLVLGRVHMTRWPKNNWNYITQNSTVFLTQNISQDDPYLLYCALHSGKNTTVVTRDLMRGHKFLLKERKYKILFNRWLSQRQQFLLYVNEQNKAFFRIPPNFSTIAQKTENIWHIPYIPEPDDSINGKYHKTWMCLNFSK